MHQIRGSFFHFIIPLQYKLRTKKINTCKVPSFHTKLSKEPIPNFLENYCVRYIPFLTFLKIIFNNFQESKVCTEIQTHLKYGSGVNYTNSIRVWIPGNQFGYVLDRVRSQPHMLPS